MLTYYLHLRDNLSFQNLIETLPLFFFFFRRKHWLPLKIYGTQHLQVDTLMSQRTSNWQKSWRAGDRHAGNNNKTIPEGFFLATQTQTLPYLSLLISLEFKKMFLSLFFFLLLSMSVSSVGSIHFPISMWQIILGSFSLLWIHICICLCVLLYFIKHLLLSARHCSRYNKEQEKVLALSS